MKTQNCPANQLELRGLKCYTLKLALSLLATCFVLSSTTRAATLETSAGKPVPEGQVSAELIKAVANFEKNSIPVMDTLTDNIVDVFVGYSFASVLQYSIVTTIISPSDKYFPSELIEFPVCVPLVTRKEVSAKVGILVCEDPSGDGQRYQRFGSLRWMAKTGSNDYGVSLLTTKPTGGVLNFAFQRKNYALRFSYTSEELTTRRLVLKTTLEREERERLEALESEEELERLRTEERLQRAEAERPVLEAQLKTIVGQTIMLDGVLALPIKSVTTFVGWYAKTREDGCIQVSESTYFSSVFSENETICAENVWLKTNYVPLKFSDKLYVPIPILNTLFPHAEFRHDIPSRTLNVQLTGEEKLVSTFKLTLPSNVPAHRTVTQSRIFKFSKDSAPKCSTATLVRSAYTATIAVGSATEFNHFTFKFSNTSSAPISIVWDDSILRFPDGQRSAVVQGTTDLGMRYQSQPPTVVAPRASHTAILLAAMKIVSLGTPYDPLYYAKLFDITAQFDENRDSLVVTGSTATINGVLAVRVGGKKVFENFSVTCTTKPGEYRR